MRHRFIFHRRGSPEAHLLLQVIKYCRARGAYIGKIKNKGTLNKAGNFIFDPYLMRGLPDALMFYNRKLYFIETKAGSNDLTPEQNDFKRNCEACDITYLVIRNLDEIIKIV